MKPVAIVAGLAAGVVGALAWAAIAYYAHVQLGILAWGIGGLVGVAVAVACKGETDSLTGAIAAVIALGAILGGKYMAAMAIASDYTPNLAAATTDAEAKEFLAIRIARGAEDAGRTLKWPEGKNLDSAERLEDYPKDVVKEAEEKWAAMSPEEQASEKAEHDKTKRLVMSTVKSSMTTAAFKASFGVLSIVFCVLALITAFKVGGGLSGDD